MFATPFSKEGANTGKYYTRRVVGPFSYDWMTLSKLILDPKASFAFNRYGDGEQAIISQEAINASQDNWKIEAGPSKISTDLAETLKNHRGQPFYYGFASIDSVESLEGFLIQTEQDLNYITYANLFVNSNYGATKKLIDKLVDGKGGDVVIIAHEDGKANSKKFKTLKQFMSVMCSLIQCQSEGPAWYENNRDIVMDEWRAMAAKYTDTLFLVSCGPLAKVAVSVMWNTNPNNRYVDVGSSIDEVLKGSKTRSYMYDGNPLATRADPPWMIKDDGRVAFLDE